MKYVVTWWERSQGSPAEYEAAQKRVLELFQPWQKPESLTIHQFVVRVGEWGGYMVLETDDLAAIHELTTILPVFKFRVEPVIDVMDAIATEVEAIKWRDAREPRGSD
jgi:muconolactone delta-isomerase